MFILSYVSETTGKTVTRQLVGKGSMQDAQEEADRLAKQWGLRSYVVEQIPERKREGNVTSLFPVEEE